MLIALVPNYLPRVGGVLRTSDSQAVPFLTPCIYYDDVIFEVE